MKLVNEGDLDYGRIKSEGKILEVTPLLYAPDGILTALPPIWYLCPNWLLGYMDHHVQQFPYTMHDTYRQSIPGTNTSAAVQIGFMSRILEHSPDMVPVTGVLTQEWVGVLASAIKEAMNNQ